MSEMIYVWGVDLRLQPFNESINLNLAFENHFICRYITLELNISNKLSPIPLSDIMLYKINFKID